MISSSYTLPETNMAPENGWLEYDRFLLGPGLCSGAMYLLVSGGGPRSNGVFPIHFRPWPWFLQGAVATLDVTRLESPTLSVARPIISGVQWLFLVPIKGGR